ncbi:unnamed protein product [Acanthosepion pharaonis]|uniref:Uncharacterized protein n=1 Tax=Acanthosepion pharaonis TaxID=158019 RepID=A0A812BUE4_ACAPH|nr:unnamed protein product [Sepia pharaonis]
MSLIITYYLSPLIASSLYSPCSSFSHPFILCSSHPVLNCPLTFCILVILYLIVSYPSFFFLIPIYLIVFCLCIFVPITMYHIPHCPLVFCLLVTLSPLLICLFKLSCSSLSLSFLCFSYPLPNNLLSLFFFFLSINPASYCLLASFICLYHLVSSHYFFGFLLCSSLFLACSSLCLNLLHSCHCLTHYPFFNFDLFTLCSSWFCTIFLPYSIFIFFLLFAFILFLLSLFTLLVSLSIHFSTCIPPYPWFLFFVLQFHCSLSFLTNTFPLFLSRFLFLFQSQI